MNNDKKTTHVAQNPSWPTEPLGRIDNVLDGIAGSVEAWDFSMANSSYEARVYFVTKIASVCYQSPKSLSSISLFDRLQAESAGLPSSSYEFVPVLLDYYDYNELGPNSNSVKYGQELDGKHWYFLTNLRAIIEDVGSEESLEYLNTSEEEIQIIRDNFKVFLFNVDLSTRAQMVRHRVSWQELSRRYVSGKKKEFEFYISKKMANLNTTTYPKQSVIRKEDWHYDDTEDEEYCTEWLVDACVHHYNTAIASGVKPEEARRILPQAMMTQIWGAFQPKQLEGFFKLRLDKHAQHEIRKTAEAMKDLL